MSIVDDINDIYDAVMRLEEENEERRIKIEAQDKLIDLLVPDIEWQERHMTDRTSPKMKSIVEAYRAVRPKP